MSSPLSMLSLSPNVPSNFRIWLDLPNYLFQFSLCTIYACYFSLKPLFAIKIEVVTFPSLFDGNTILICCGLLVQRLILPP